MNRALGTVWKETLVVWFNALFLHMSLWDWGKPWDILGHPVSCPLFEPRTSRLRSRSANHSADTFGDSCLAGPLSPRHGAPLGCGWRKQPPDAKGSWEYSILKKQSCTAERGWSSNLGNGQGAKLAVKENNFFKMLRRTLDFRAHLKTVMNLRASVNGVGVLASWAIISFSRTWVWCTFQHGAIRVSGPRCQVVPELSCLLWGYVPALAQFLAGDRWGRTALLGDSGCHPHSSWVPSGLRCVNCRHVPEARVSVLCYASGFVHLRPALGPTQPPVQWVPGVLSLGLKHGRGVTLTTQSYLVPMSRMSRSYTSFPSKRHHGV
jgi:hypothetical protein